MAERILVTGGAGFIGSHLCESLAKKGYEIVALDNFATGKRSNLRKIPVKLIKHDITKPFAKKLARLGKFDFVFNLASPASPVDYQKLSIPTLLVGSLGMKNSLDFAKANSARLLQASTSEVYGDPLIHPQTEGYWGNVNPIGPRSCYDEAKRYAESLCMAYAREGTPVVLARIFNTYGPRMRLDDGRVVPNLVGQALRNEPLTVYGDGSQTRSFCYVSDLVEGLEKLMFSSLQGDVFNVGNPEEHSILEFAQLVKQLTGASSEITYLPLPQDDPKRRKPDISKIKAALGWEPKVKLEDGMKETIAWFKKEVRKNKKKEALQ